MRRLGLLVCVVLMIAGCSAVPSAVVPTFVPPTFGTMPTPSPLIGRTMVRVARGDLIDTVTIRGEMTADPQTALAFPTGGVVKEVYAATGDSVTKGIVLAELDASALQRAALQSAYDLAVAEIDLARAEDQAADDSALKIAQEQLSLAKLLPESMLADVIKSESAVKLAQVRLAQVESSGMGSDEVEIARENLAQAQALDQALKAQLSGVGSSSPVSRRDALARTINIAIAQLALAQAEAQQAEAQQDVALARARVDLARAFDALAQKQLDETILVAPFSGTLTSFVTAPGDNVVAYDPVGMLADVDNLQVRAMLPVDVAALMEVGQAVEIVLDGQQSRGYTGTVQAVDPTVQSWQGQSAQEAIFRFDASQDVPPVVGIGVSIRLSKPLRENVLLVPQEAVARVAGQTYLDVVFGEDQVQRVPVVTGAIATGAVEIVSGVEEGQAVVLP